MKQYSKEVSIAQMIGALTFVSSVSSYHVSAEIRTAGVQLDVFLPSAAALVSLESQLRVFMTEGCSLDSGYLQDAGSYYLIITWPCPNVFAR